MFLPYSSIFLYPSLGFLSLSLSLAMADEAQYSSGPDSASNKRKYDDQTAPPPATRRPTGFSAPIAPHSPDSALAPPPPSYNTVPPPVDGLTLAKQRAQEVAARLFNNSGAGAVAATAGLDAKRPKIENGASGFDSHDSGFSSVPPGSTSLSLFLRVFVFGFFDLYVSTWVDYFCF